MEFGLFIFLTAIGALGYWRNSNLYMVVMSIVAFFIVALLLVVDGNVVQTQLFDHTTQYLSATNSSQGSTHETGSTQNVVLKDNIITVSYIYYGFAALGTLIMMYRSMQLAKGKY